MGGASGSCGQRHKNIKLYSCHTRGDIYSLHMGSSGGLFSAGHVCTTSAVSFVAEEQLLLGDGDDGAPPPLSMAEASHLTGPRSAVTIQTSRPQGRAETDQ